MITVTKKDFEMTWFSGTGAGGQHRNKHQNCCRIKHVPSGVISTGQSHRERSGNQREALMGLAKNPRFRSWCFLRLMEQEENKTVEQWVEEQVQPQNIKTEVKDGNGRWVTTITWGGVS